MDEFLDLTIETGNAAMQTPEDVAEALERVANEIRKGAGNGTIFDLNGNSVGYFRFSPNRPRVWSAAQP